MYIFMKRFFFIYYLRNYAKRILEKSSSYIYLRKGEKVSTISRCSCAFNDQMKMQCAIDHHKLPN